jgi:capsular exopolysaccharide synthesis family protein
MIAAMLGLAAGVGFAFLLEYMDNTVKTPEEAERKLGLPTLGVVPSFDTPSLSYGAYSYGSSRSSRRNGAGPEVTNGTSGDNKGLVTITGPSSEIIVSRYPKSVISEAYRSIRTAILLSSADHPPQVISFTSGAAGEGKTVSAINQAVVLGQAGGRVLLIDADTRKPRVHRVFKLPNAAGLSTFLTGQSTLDEVIRQVSLSDVPGGNVEPATNGQGSLFVLPSGPLPPNPAELIGSTKMRETIETLRKHFDYIVIDTPPVLPVTDAVLVAGMSDGVVLVVRGQETPIDLVAKSRDRLASARTKILGILLNDVDITTGDYYHYHRYYYSYYAEEHA